jgi:adenylate kinase
MKKTPFNLILLGDPASGKGTQAAMLVKKYHLYDFDMGKEVTKPSVRAQYDYAKTTAIGHLTPTAVVRGIFERVIRTVPPEKGILFNGTPKMIGEARLVAKWLWQYKRSDPMGEVISRAKKRRVSKGGKAVKRDDDTEAALRNRKRYYEEQVSRVVEFFKKKYAFKNISGSGSRAEVRARIIAAIHDHVS